MFLRLNLKLRYSDRSSGIVQLIHYFSSAAWLWLLIRSVGIFRSFQLNLQSFHSDLETIHRLNSCLSTGRIIKWNKTCWWEKGEKNVKLVESWNWPSWNLPKHLLWLVARSINTFELITVPNGINICINSPSPNSWGRW